MSHSSFSQTLVILSLFNSLTHEGTDIIEANTKMFADEEPTEFGLGAYADVEDAFLAGVKTRV